MPFKVMAGKNLPWQNASLSGKSWTVLSGTAAQRLHPLARPYQRSILVLLGGQSDLAIGSENNSAEVALADMEAYADAARAAGFDTIVASTVPPAAMFDAEDETQRLAFNAGIRNSTHWEEVAEVGDIPELQNYNNTTYYSDGIHWAPAGATAAANVVRPVLESVL